MGKNLEPKLDWDRSVVVSNKESNNSFVETLPGAASEFTRTVSIPNPVYYQFQLYCGTLESLLHLHRQRMVSQGSFRLVNCSVSLF